MNNDTFHYFSKLPVESRLLIWEHCLPHRVAEEDECDFLLDGNNSRHACYAKRITHLNTRLPVIAFVNSESRQVALEQGRWFKPGLGIRTDLESLWVQPRRDVVHLNWQRMRYIDIGYDEFEKESPVYMFMHHAEELRVQPSVVAEVIHPFSLLLAVKTLIIKSGMQGPAQKPQIRDS